MLPLVLPQLVRFYEYAGHFLSLRFSPEVEKPPLATEVRSRPSQKQKQKQKSEIPEDIPERQTTEEKPKTTKRKTSSKWRWVLLVVVLILIIFTAAVVYNFEKLPEFNKKLPSLEQQNSTDSNTT